MKTRMLCANKPFVQSIIFLSLILYTIPVRHTNDNLPEQPPVIHDRLFTKLIRLLKSVNHKQACKILSEG